MQIVKLGSLTFLLITSVSYGATCSRVTSFTDGDVLFASDLNTEFSNAVNCVNAITNDNISSGAAIDPSKISATIAGDGISRDAGTGALAVNPDGTVLSISGDTLQITDSAIPESKLAPVLQAGSADDLTNLSVVPTVSGNALTITLKDAAGATLTSSNKAKVALKNSNSTGNYVLRYVTSNLTLTVSSGSTLGQTSGTAGFVYVYLIDNAGALELAISGSLLTPGASTTTAEGGAGGADSITAIYSTAARASVNTRVIAVLNITEATAGTWVTLPSSTQILNDDPISESRLTGSSVVTGKLADGAVTQAKRVALGQQLSSSSGSFSTTSTSYVDVTNLTDTITTTGRPVWVGLESDGGGTICVVGSTATSGVTGISATVGIIRGATEISTLGIFNGGSSSSLLAVSLPCSSVNHIDVVGAGTYTYKVQVKGSSNSTGRVQQAKLLVYEL